MEFQSRAVRSLVELHEKEMRSFLEVWKRFVAANLPMPDAHGDPDYENREKLAGHVLMAARGYLRRIGIWLDRAPSGLDDSEDANEIAARAPQFLDNVLAAYRRHLAGVTHEEMEAYIHHTRGGQLMNVELLLEHAVVHPMRHRIQLERMLEGKATAKA
jgi:uncharacterized damage-inducible protein DinB